VDQVDERRSCCGSSPGRVALAVAAVLVHLVVLGGGRPAAAAPPGRVRLVRQTSWVAPGETLTMAVRTADVVDPAALEMAVTVHPAVKSRNDLARSSRGEGLTAPLSRADSVVPLPLVPANVDGSLSVAVPTRAAGSASDPARVRLPGPGIYPVQVELREAGGGDTVDRFTTHLLAVEAPDDGTRLGTAVVLPLSAPPSTGLEGVANGPPAGASALADVAAGLTAAAKVPVTLAPTPEVLESLEATAPTTAAALKEALAERPVLARPYVPIHLPALGAAGVPLLPQQLAAGREAATDVLGREPAGGMWLADEPLDGPALTQVTAAGATRVIVPQRLLGPVGPAVPAPLRPVVLTPPGSAAAATLLLADGVVAAALDGRGAALDQPLLAHHLLADLAAIATLPADRDGPALEGNLDRRVVTVVADRTFMPTSTFLTELLGGLAASPTLEAIDLGTAFGRSPEPAGSGGTAQPAAPPPARATTTARNRRGTTTTTAPPTGRSLAPVQVGDRGIGDLAGEAIWQLESHGQVLADTTPLDEPDPAGGPNGTRRERQAPTAAELRQRLLVATSADLPVDEQRGRLRALADGAKADLGALKMPEGRSLRLTARAGQLPVGIFNDTGRTARVMLQLDSEKLEFPEGNQVQVVLDRRTTTELVKVRVRAAGSFPVKVRLLTPDGGRVLQETEYSVRANTLPGVAIVVSGAAAVFLGGWWAKTLLPERRHLRRRKPRRRDRPTG
jgi:hypothetical protein